MKHDTAFQMASSNIRFGADTTREVGFDLADLGARRTLVVIDPALTDLAVGRIVEESLTSAGIDYDIFDKIAIEPTNVSFMEAIEFATAGKFDSYLAVGGGSTIDTAKAANLYASWPAEFFAYVNAPIGEGRAVPGPVKPLIAIPTTAGTGSETTAVAVFDDLDRKAKTGISHRYLKPALGIIDPENTRTMPPAVAAATGLDVLSHALESFTAIPFDSRPRPARPGERPAYQGANPLSDVWALRSLEILAEYLPRAVADTNDDEARAQMLLASTIAGIGFGNAGVHLPHAMAYPIAGLVRDYRPPGYNVDYPLIPHGISVVLNTPAVARFTAPASPTRHLRAAAALGADIQDAPLADAGRILAERVIYFMRTLGLPNGLMDVGYTEADIPALVAGALPQQRLTKLSPVLVGEEGLAMLFRESMRVW